MLSTFWIRPGQIRRLFTYSVIGRFLLYTFYSLFYLKEIVENYGTYAHFLSLRESVSLRS